MRSLVKIIICLVVFAQPLWAAPQVAPFCRDYLLRLTGALRSEEKVKWPSRLLSGEPISRSDIAYAKKRVREIVRDIYEIDSDLGREVDRELHEKISRGSQWLEMYFRAYEIFYYSPQYLSVVNRIHENLPKNGGILDVGSGTGGMGQLLAEAEFGRSVSALDHDRALGISKDRIALLFPGEEGRFSYLPFYIGGKRSFPTERTFDGGVINHMLYSMIAKTKESALRGMVEKMKPGATIVINEPVRGAVHNENSYREWMTGVMESAVLNGAPHSEFDVAMLTAVASGRLTRGFRGGAEMVRPMMNEAEHLALFKQFGLEVVSSEPTYGGFSRLWVLKVQ